MGPRPRQILDAVIPALNESEPDDGYMDASREQPSPYGRERETVAVDGWAYTDEVEARLAHILAELDS